jgi:hypothetical protein
MSIRCTSETTIQKIELSKLKKIKANKFHLNVIKRIKGFKCSFRLGKLLSKIRLT